ncbi:ERMES complex subunit [Apophysomyces ossiformis]|uniref:Mitochondrial distribution and morphology protein 34 n=1 Tax=Apophysomyces ossiformis TaxID=679940 RepID=A0A8H7ET26_9FUNG|nr:ERMES complex subunit [Apophysomyces ossiformis]
MAFRFNWPEFDNEFYDEAQSQLEAALNKGNKPKNIVDHIAVKELHMGTQPPELEILEIGELSTDKFRGIFKLTYAGDAYIVLQTKVQANPMHSKQSDLPRHTRPSILAADQPLVVPMLLRISDLKLRGIVVLVVSKTKGITLVFKNDPLESILVSSTFDSVTSVRNFLQREIEKQLRNLFQEDLPVMIHNLSLRHIQSEQEKAKKQQQEERLKMQRLRKMERDRQKRANGGVPSPPLSVFSDPGAQGNRTPIPNLPRSSPYDCLSMPDLSPNLPTSGQSQVVTPSISARLSSPSDYPYLDDAFLDCIPTGSFRSSVPPGTFSDLYNSEHDLAKGSLRSTVDGYFDGIGSVHNGSSIDSGRTATQQQQTYRSPFPAGAPVTAANLSTLNRLYNYRFAMMNGQVPFYADQQQQNYEDTQSEVDSSCINDSPSSVQSLAAHDIYVDDVDAPWYVTEGPELPSSNNIEQPFTLPLDQEIVVNPSENVIAHKLAQLTCINHTISPFAYTIDHFTYRSLPHTVKKVDSKPKHKKIPKRRIIRLNTQSSLSS